MRAALIVLAAAFLLVGGILFAIGGHAVLDTWRYRQAVRTEAVATGTTLRIATETSDTTYVIAYRAVLDGQVLERTDAVPVHLWERVERDSVVPLEHLPGRPESVRVVTDTSNENTRSFVFTAIGALLILGGLTAGTRSMQRRPDHEPPQQVSSTAVPARELSYWPLARRSPGFWIGAIFLLVATPFVVVAMLQIEEEWRFARSSVSTDGMILTKEIKRSRRAPHRAIGYELTYRVLVPEGAFENRASLSYDAWARLKERQAAEVLYLPERPATSRLAGPQRWMPAAFMAILGSVFFAIGATFLHRSIRQARLEWRLRQRGAAADGVVIEVRDRQLEINGVRQWRLRYEYDDFRGSRHAATHDLPEDEALEWTIGAVGAVRYDPGRPTDAIWLGRSS